MPKVFLLLVLFSATWCNADPIEIEGSRSPDGKFYLAIDPSKDDHMFTSDMLQIRRTTDKNLVATFEWGQFGPHISSTSAKALWRSDSGAFALTWYMARGWTGSEVFLMGNDGLTWSQVSFPLFKGKHIGHDGWGSGGKGHLIVVAWQPNGVLKVDYVGKLQWDGPGNQPPLGDVAEDDWAYFRIVESKSGPSLELVRLDQKTEGEINTEYGR